MKLKMLAVAALTCAWAIPAPAQSVQARDPESLVQALQEAGYAAKLGTDKVGDPLITSGVWGTTFQILFYNCTDHMACATVQFHSGYVLKNPVGLDHLNEWNRVNRFGRAFLDKEHDPVIEMDLDLDEGGMSRALFTHNVEFWATVLSEFERHIGYRK